MINQQMKQLQCDSAMSEPPSSLPMVVGRPSSERSEGPEPQPARMSPDVEQLATWMSMMEATWCHQFN